MHEFRKIQTNMKGLEIIVLAVGGVLGTFLRYKITESPLLFGVLPINILIVNVLGAFILGLFVAVSQEWNIDGKYAFLIAIGFCGSLTTMSALALETSNMIGNLQFGLASINILVNVGFSLAAIMAGRALMKVIISTGLL